MNNYELHVATHTCHYDCQNPICIAVRKAIAEEREACAALCDAEAERVRDLHDRLDDLCIDALLGKELSARSLAFAIRERGAP